MRCRVQDFFTVDFASTKRVTDGDTGFVHVPGRLARAGVQTYRAREIDGLTGYKPDAVIRLYRSPETLVKAAPSFNHKPITDGHPDLKRYPFGVTKDNWRALAKGHTTDIVGTADGFMDGMLHLTDAAGIASLQSGRRELSLGYAFTLNMQSGRTADGQDFDGEMIDLVGNHTAIVDRARGGDGCRAADSHRGDKAMRKIIVDGVSLELEDTQADIMDKLLQARDGALTDLANTVVSGKRALDGLRVDKDAEIAKLRAQIVTPENFKLMVADHASVLAECTKRCPAVKTEGLTTRDMRTEMFKGITGANTAAKRIGDAVLPGGVTDKTPEPAIKMALDAIFAAVDTSTQDGIAARTTVATGLTPTTPVGEKPKTAHDEAPKPLGRDAYVHNMTTPTAATK